MDVSDQLLPIDVELSESVGEKAGTDVALTEICFEFVAPPGLVKVNVTV